MSVLPTTKVSPPTPIIGYNRISSVCMPNLPDEIVASGCKYCPRLKNTRIIK